ncbi:hypothetical protein ACFRH6_16870 [Streptomyces sp. NPDC056749]|uniref:hypothetical protein n=1 Tax=Streptomyces sp. NPDC056749 TaxID=3345936 RepID=UPI003674AA69
MPEKTPQHWTDSLFDSVYALYETAREYQTAHRAALVAMQTVDVDRRQLHTGRVRLWKTAHGPQRSFRRVPHERAVFDIYDLYSKTEQKLHRRYEEAALLFASGCAWAITLVQAGNHPPFVEFNHDVDEAAVPHAMNISGLDRYAGARELAASYDRVTTCMNADEHGEDLAGRDYVTDHEAGQMHDAIDIALGLADAAFAYGLLAQRAVSYVLLEPRRARERELAAARAAAQQTAQPTV